MTPHPDDAAFLASIIAKPAGDLPRLIWCDHLEETAGEVPCPACRDGGRPGWTTYPHPPTVPDDWDKCRQCHGTGRVSDGRGERAEVIRLQLASKGDDSLARQVWMILNDRAERWAPRPPGVEFIWWRGFVAEVRLSLSAFVGGPCARCGATGWYNSSSGDGNEPCPDCGGRWDGDSEVAFTAGSGTAPALGPAIAAAHPVERWVIVGAVPYWNGAAHCWYLPDRHRPTAVVPESAVLTADLIDLLAGFSHAAGRRWKGYPTREAALAALAAACRAWAAAGKAVPA